MCILYTYIILVLSEFEYGTVLRPPQENHRWSNAEMKECARKLGLVLQIVSVNDWSIVWILALKEF